MFEAIDHVGKHAKPLAYEAVLILTAIKPIERIDPIGADLVECDASALLERLRDHRGDTHQRWRHKKKSAHEVVRAFRGKEKGIFIGQLKCLGRRVVDQITRTSHSFQPFLDVAKLEPGSLGNRYRRHWPFAGHRAKQTAFDAQIGHADRHRSGHVSVNLIGECPDLSLIHERLRNGECKALKSAYQAQERSRLPLFQRVSRLQLSNILGVHQTGALYSLVLDVRIELGRFESVPSLAQNPRGAREPNLPDCCARVSRAAMLRPRR